MKKRLPIYVLFATSFLSITGNVLASIAIPWFVLKTTGSASQTGITAFFSIVPVVLATFFGGTLVDRLGYKRVSVVADIASGFAVLFIPILYLSGNLAFWQLLVLVFLGALLDTPGMSARSAMIPELAAAAGMSIDRATSIGSVLRRATTMVGGLTAGLLVATVGEVNLLWLDAGTFFLSAAGIAFAVPASLIPAPEPKEDGEKPSYLDDFREGFRFVRADKLILTFILVIMLTNMVDMAMFSVGLPVYLEGLFGAERGASYMGLLIGVFSIGAVIATWLWGWKGEKFSRRWMFTMAFIVVGARFFFLMTLPPLWALFIIYALAGIAAAPINPIIASVMYERTPPTMRGRVFGLLNSGITGAMPLGVLVTGFLLEGIGIRWTLLLFGLIYAAATLSLLFNPNTGEMDKKEPEPAPPEAAPQRA